MRRRGYSQCHSPISKTVWEVHNRVFEMIGQRLSANAMDFVLDLLHVGRARQLTSAGE